VKSTRTPLAAAVLAAAIVGLGATPYYRRGSSTPQNLVTDEGAYLVTDTGAYLVTT
jgi:hypothetical protein